MRRTDRRVTRGEVDDDRFMPLFGSFETRLICPKDHIIFNQVSDRNFWISASYRHLSSAMPKRPPPGPKNFAPKYWQQLPTVPSMRAPLPQRPLKR